MGNRWKFLSYRVLIFGSVFLASGGLVFLLMLIYADIEGIEELLVMALVGLLLLVMTLLFITQIICPYYKYEQNVRLFLLGYTSEGLKDKGVTLSPTSEQLAAMLARLTESEQLLNANKKQAQYLALQNQINPHFLYNTLENIRSEALFEGADSVAEMTEKLSTFFRYTMSNMDNLVTLKEELENVSIYFTIQKHRFEERLNLVIECDEDESCLDCLMPKLTLQPIVENSIIHGLEQKVGQGTVRIVIRCTGKRLIIQISDDGAGMKPDVLERLNRQLNEPVFESIRLSDAKGGVAIINVSNRIHLLFGEEYGMVVYSTLDFGTDTIINLPLVKSREEKNRGEKKIERRDFKDGEGYIHRAGDHDAK